MRHDFLSIGTGTDMVTDRCEVVDATGPAQVLMPAPTQTQTQDTFKHMEDTMKVISNFV